jgi:hypothetical protein
MAAVATAAAVAVATWLLSERQLRRLWLQRLLVAPVNNPPALEQHADVTS